MFKNSDFAIVLNDCDNGRVIANFSCEINDANEKTIVYQSKKAIQMIMIQQHFLNFLECCVILKFYQKYLMEEMINMNYPKI